MTVRPITAAETRPLRGDILRPGQPPEDLVYPGDDAPGSFHAGAFADGTLVGIATVYPEPMPRPPEGLPRAADLDPANAFRLRGMATRAGLQGHGIGRAVLGRCIEHVRASGAEVLWCNARVGALGFYHRLGFHTVGDEFDIAGIGPHYVMWKGVRTDDA
jgi:GNAT superfamily N-acetyltransferase